MNLVEMSNIIYKRCNDIIKYGKKIEDVFDIKELLNSKKLIDDGEYIYINLDYIYLSNEILVNFI